MTSQSTPNDSPKLSAPVGSITPICKGCGKDIDDTRYGYLQAAYKGQIPLDKFYHQQCEPKKSERESCLQQAIEYVTKDRNLQYGAPENEFAVIAELITPIIRDCVDPEDLELIVVKPHHVALILTQLKIARIIHNPGKFDSWVDGCGYLACGWDTVVEEKKRG